MLLLLLGATLVAFAPALEGEFLDYDDDVNFARNSRFRGLGTEPLHWMFTTGWMGHYQPLSWMTLGADYARAGLDGPAFHRTSLAWHALTALLLLGFARCLLANGGIRGAGREVGALTAALLFAVHPLRVESVVWITERRDLVSGAFFLAALIAWTIGPWKRPVRTFGGVRAAAAIALAVAAAALFFASVDLDIIESLAFRSNAPWTLPLAGLALAATVAVAAPGARSSAALALLSLSLLAKAWGIVMPALLLVLDFWPRRRGRLVDMLLEKIPFAVLAVVFSALATWAQAGLDGTMKSLVDHGIGARISQAFYGLAFYPAKTLIPVSLGPFYDLPEQLDPLAPRFLVPILAVTAITLALVVWRRRFPAGLAAWAAFAIVVSPVLGILQSGPQLVAERYSYLSCMPFVLLIGAGVGVAFRRPRRGILVLVGVGGLALGLGFATRDLAAAWSTSGSLWAHVREARPNHSAGWLYSSQQMQEQAHSATNPVERIRLLEDAQAIREEGMACSSDPRLPMTLAALLGEQAVCEEAGGADPSRVQELRRRAVREARRAFEDAVSRQEILPEYRLGFGRALREGGHSKEAIEYLEWFAARFPKRADSRIELGRALLDLGRTADALREIGAGARLAPRDVSAWIALSDARVATGDRPGARQAIQRAIALDPDDEDSRARLRKLLQP